MSSSIFSQNIHFIIKIFTHQICINYANFFVFPSKFRMALSVSASKAALSHAFYMTNCPREMAMRIPLEEHNEMGTRDKVDGMREAMFKRLENLRDVFEIGA